MRTPRSDPETREKAEDLRSDTNPAVEPKQMQDLKKRITQAAKSQAENLNSIRQHLHQNPELSFQEHQTQAYVASQLEQLGIPHKSIAGTGLLAEIDAGPGPTIALRADLDALPIQEKNEAPYASQNPGVMHACGHDVHTTSLLGAAAILQVIKNKLKGKVRLLFQPGEEQLPGGATLMLRDGALKNPTPEALFGQHVHPPLEVGKVGFRPGIYMASTDEIYLTIHGRGGHGAMPHDSVDPIVVTSHIVTAAQQLISRQTDPTLPAVLTFGYIASDGGATNVIPNSVSLKGTLRTLNEEWRAELHQRLRRLVTGMAESMGAKAELEIRHGYPFLRNDEQLTRWAFGAAQEYLGEENVVELPIRMTGEDFAFYTHHLPACFYRLGVRDSSWPEERPVHTDTFDVADGSLVTGSGLMAWLVAKQLS